MVSSIGKGVEDPRDSQRLTDRGARETLLSYMSDREWQTPSHLSNTCVLPEKHLPMDSIKIDRLAQRIKERRSGKGIREAAAEVGVSPATLSRVENGKIPDLETFSRICRWLDEDPAVYLGLRATELSTAPPTALVHFKKGAAIRPDSAKALGEMIIAAQRALMEEEQEG
jgi:transcriptional regulator with XRE-family HTH domain